MENKNKIRLALAAGVIVGGILGLLFAPEKGTETRKKVADYGKKFSDTVRERFEKSKNGKEHVAA